MSRRKGFFTVSYEACHLPGLAPLEIMVLSRICSFGIFFESAEATAEFLNRSPKSVRNAKQRLVKMKYIYVVEDTGRGKKYIARADLRARDFSKKDLQKLDEIREKAIREKGSFYIPDIFMEKAQAEKVAELTSDTGPVEDPTPKESPTTLKPSKTFVPEYSDKRAYKRWKEKHPDLVNVYTECLDYLADCKIPALDHTALRRDLTTVADLYRNESDPEAHTYMIETYIDYLRSEEYKYQAENARFCPRITTQSDLFGKFNAIREFKYATDRHYNPSH